MPSGPGTNSQPGLTSRGFQCFWEFLFVGDRVAVVESKAGKSTKLCRTQTTSPTRKDLKKIRPSIQTPPGIMKLWYLRFFFCGGGAGGCVQLRDVCRLIGIKK